MGYLYPTATSGTHVLVHHKRKAKRVIVMQLVTSLNAQSAAHGVMVHGMVETLETSHDLLLQHSPSSL